MFYFQSGRIQDGVGGGKRKVRNVIGGSMVVGAVVLSLWCGRGNWVGLNTLEGLLWSGLERLWSL